MVNLDIFLVSARNINHSDSANCKVTIGEIEDDFKCIFPLYDHIFWIGLLSCLFLVLEIVLQAYTVYDFQWNQQKKAKDIIKFCEKIRKDVEAPFEENVENCDLFLLINCLIKKYDEEVAMLLLALVDKNVRGIWKSLRMELLSETSAKVTINPDYTNIISKFCSLLPNTQVSFKSSGEVKKRFRVSELGSGTADLTEMNFDETIDMVVREVFILQWKVNLKIFAPKVSTIFGVITMLYSTNF